MINIQGNLFYRKIERDDLVKRVEWINNPDLNNTLTFQTPVSLSSTERWFDNVLSDSTKMNLTFFIQEDENYIPIGFGGFIGIDKHNRRAELFITIGNQKFQGLGYGKVIVNFLKQFGFDCLNLQRIHLTTLSHNVKAKSLYEKCGFVQEGTLNNHFFHKGEYKDCYYMAVLKESI